VKVERKSIDGGVTYYYTVLVAANEMRYEGLVMPFSTWIGTLKLWEDHVEARVWVPAVDPPGPLAFYKARAREMLREAAGMLRADLEVRFK
jgi:hypothetical protein